MEIISVGEEWAQKVVCGKLPEHSESRPGRPGLVQKTNWDKGCLGFRCAHCKTVILFDSSVVDGKNRDWVFAECEYPPIHIGLALKNKRVENI